MYADVPDSRDCYENFHPRILAILCNQEDECERLAGMLYTKGLTQEQFGEVSRISMAST